jgi:hypothetical protein
MRSLVLLAVLTLAACATTAAEQPIGERPGGGACRTEGLGRYVGQPANVDVAAEILRDSGARTLRWTGPGIAVTMDFSPDRINVDLDQSLSRIVGFNCG